MVGLRVADGVRRHVRQHQVGGPAERFAQLLRRGLVHEIHLQDLDALDRLGRQQVDAGDPRLRGAAAHHLAPSARSDAEVDHRLDALEQPEALVELEQLIGGAAAVILRLGAAHIGIVQLPLEPAGRRGGAPPGGLDPLPRAAAAGHST